MQDLDKFKNEMNLSGKNVYVGHRYAPKIMGDWDNTQIYEPLSIVQYQGNSFTSRQFVPTGIEITNEEFWASTGNYNAQVEQYRQDVVNLRNDVNKFNNLNSEVITARNGEATLSDRLNKEQQEVNTQLAQIGNVRNKEVSLYEYEDLVTGDDWTNAFEQAVLDTSANKQILVLPDEPIKISEIIFDGVADIHLKFLKGSILHPLDSIESRFLVFKNCTNFKCNHYKANGFNHYRTGLTFLEGNDGVTIDTVDIKNISPIIRENPTDIASYGLFIATHNNHNFHINEVYVDGVKNNDNGIIGDSIGSSRGIIFDNVRETQTIPCTNIRIGYSEISNVRSEDGDGIQFAGNGVKHDIRLGLVKTDNTTRRALKFQGLKGVTVERLEAKHTDRTFSMETGVSMLTHGNSLLSYYLDIKAVKGMEFSPNDISDIPTFIGDGTINIEDIQTLNGSVVVACDILTAVSDVYANNLIVDGVYTTVKNATTVFVRAATKNSLIKNVHNPVGNVAVSIQKEVAGLVDDRTHESLIIDTIISKTLPVITNSDVTYKQSHVNNLKSLNGTLPYSQFRFTRGLSGSIEQEFGNSMPTTGSYVTGDYVKNMTPKREWVNDLASWKTVKGWIRLTTGSEHVLNTDWVEDAVLVGQQT